MQIGVVRCDSLVLSLGMLDRALAKISTDLYSEDVHFVLELIQNADGS